MARIRTIKPEFWTDGDVMDLSPYARLLFIGSWNFALCDNGHVADDPRRLKMQVLPADDVDGYALVDELLACGRLERITVDNRTFLWIKRFTDHQKTEKRWSPRCPACTALSLNDPDKPDVEPLSTSLNLSETPPTSAQEGKGRERKGKDSVVTSSLHLQSVPAQPVDDDGLRQIQDLTNAPDLDHAAATAVQILKLSTTPIRKPLAYIVKTIDNDPERYRFKRGSPRRGDPGECKMHAGQWADVCSGCAADRIAAT